MSAFSNNDEGVKQNVMERTMMVRRTNKTDYSA